MLTDKSEGFFGTDDAHPGTFKESEDQSVDIVSSPIIKDNSVSLLDSNSPCKTLPTWDHSQSVESRSSLQDEQPTQTLPKGPVLQQLIEGLEEQEGYNKLARPTTQPLNKQDSE